MAKPIESKTTQDLHEMQKEIFRTKRSYVPVDVEKRQRLIKAVEEDGLTIKEAAQNLKINYSTAKHIVKVYKRTGELQASASNSIIGKRQPERELRSLEDEAYQSIARGNPSAIVGH